MTAFTGLGFLSWIIVGLIAGAIARLILPGKQSRGFWLNLIAGVLGAVLGGLIAGLIWPNADWGFWNFWTWVWAIGGSVVVLLLWGFIAGSRGKNKGASKV